MPLYKNNKDLIGFLSAITQEHETIGFVPTMGALHKGHLSLISKSLQENSYTVVSIFVNPTQFNNQEDLDKYPRTLTADLEKIQLLSSQVIVYAPSVQDVYEQSAVAVSFKFDGLELQMEGKHRPGHFDGVGTIVKKLFEIVKPTRAYFGEKDFQQLQIVKKLVSKYNLPVTIVGCPIHRESNGLAMSSRNERLSDSQKQEAAFIYKTLLEVKDLFLTHDITFINQWVLQAFEANNHITLEYFEIANQDTLLTSNNKQPGVVYRAFIAVFINNIRLIDNISLN